MILLDNNILRKYARKNPDEAVVDYLTAKRTEPWGLSAIVLYEFLSYYDSQPEQSRRRSQLNEAVDDVLAFDADTATEAASMETALASVGVSLDVADLFIAATARQHGATLATADRSDFDAPELHELVDMDIVDCA